MSNTGKVYLVGAGPGNLDYLTVKGQQLLSIAQVLIYDALVDPQLLKLVSPDCLQLYVGKRGGGTSTPQTQIDRLLVNYCLQGKQVVRLKSGDPLIFGRAGSEIEALTEAGCPYEVIPGISSVIAAPLLAGIPLTDRTLSSCFVVLSAHDPKIIDWEAVSRIDTVVILMGGSSLKEIVRQLTKFGRTPEEPIAIIRNCSRQDQQVWLGKLTTIVGQTANLSLSPAVIVIGKVVEFGNQLNSKRTLLPLQGKTVLVTRAAEQSSQFTTLLQQQGATVLEMPALEITTPSSWQDLDRAIVLLESFHWLILTSANGVQYFFDRLNTLNKDARSLGNLKIAVVGKKTAATLKKYHLQADFIPPDFVADSLVENFPDTLGDKKILFPRVETGGREILVKELTNVGAEVIEVAAYQSKCPDRIDSIVWDALDRQQIDIITFASSKTVQNFYLLIQKALINHPDLTSESLLQNVCIASIGPQTSKTCQELLGRVDVEAKEYTLEGLIEAILRFNPPNEFLLKTANF
jgi:uroporphyrinogen III methyltransferase / synthase